MRGLESMFDFIWKHIPEDYKWSVGIKKASQMAGKALAGLIVGSAVGKHLPPESAQYVEMGVTIMTTATLEAIHDWAKLKWPDKKWL